MKMTKKAFKECTKKLVQAVEVARALHPEVKQGRSRLAKYDSDGKLCECCYLGFAHLGLFPTIGLKETAEPLGPEGMSEKRLFDALPCLTARIQLTSDFDEAPFTKELGGHIVDLNDGEGKTTDFISGVVSGAMSEEDPRMEIE